jgi:hypothetical protein
MRKRSTSAVAIAQLLVVTAFGINLATKKRPVEFSIGLSLFLTSQLITGGRFLDTRYS